MSLFFLGTSHVSAESVQQITDAIDSFKPDIVCVELDRQRLTGLLKKQKPSYSPRLIFELGLGGYLFAVVGGFVQQKLGNVVGTTPGGDMLTAVKAARVKNISVSLIDQPIQTTMRRVSSAFTFQVIFNMIVDFFAGIIMPKRTQKRLGLESFSLSSAPTDAFIRAATNYLRNRYPTLYLVLLTERNEYMVSRIYKIQELNENARILVVVGAAHVSGMQELVHNHYKSASEKRLV